MSFKCPKCRRQLYNRRKPTCSFCGAAVPAELRMSEMKAAFIEKMKTDEAKCHREFMERDILTGDDTIIDIPDLPDLSSGHFG